MYIPSLRYAYANVPIGVNADAAPGVSPPEVL